MLRVRFPSGITVQYNTAYHLSYYETRWELYTEKGGDLVASIQASAGVIVEAVEACSIYQAVGDPDGTKLSSVLSDVSAIKRKISKLSTAERKRRL